MRSIVIGTAGHIDHGKSALVRALTGTDPDRLKEEQARGITIDLGFAHVTEADTSLSFVDVPGHERFVKNMLAGAGGIDLVMLVVAADESVMPQTREHFHICRLLRVPAGVIVLTKTDLADAETIELATMEVRDLAQGSFLEGAPIVPVSSRTGQGLDALRAALVASATHAPQREEGGPVRLPIDRVFSIKGFGTVATGTLVSGTIREEAELVVLPSERTVKVRGLQVHGRREASAGAGRRVAVNLGGVDVSELCRGDTLADRDAFEPTRRIDVALDLLEEVRPLRHGARVRFHNGTTELLGRVALAGSAMETGTPPVYARIRLESAAVVTRGDRFILRAYSPVVTIGGGVVLDPHPARGAVRNGAALERFRALDSHAPGAHENDVLVRFIEERGGAGMRRRDIVARAGLSHAAAARAVDRVVAGGKAILLDDLLVSPMVLTDLADRLVRDLTSHHAANALSNGMPREEARDRIFRRAHPAVFEAVVGTLASTNRIVARDRLTLPGHQVSLTPHESAAHTAIERIYREANLTPPDLASATLAAAAPRAIVDRVVQLLVRNRTLVRVESLLFHASALDELKANVRALKAEGEHARVDVATFKARYGITRKYAIPLLEYLDRERVTRRVGETRIVL
ncbi:MAG TPA: selenocysteine-specific translation elongation factor [Vicinamibacterales bacterium]